MEIIILTLLYFITRLPFIHTIPVYYDSFEYLRIVQKLDWGNFSSIISSSHQPIHSFYFLTVLFIKSILPFAPAGFHLALLSLLFGYGTVIVWYFTIKYILPKTPAIIAALLFIFFPLFFITNTHILYESELLFFQVVSMYLFFKGVKTKNYIFLFLSGISLGIAHLVFIGTAFIVPLFFIVLSFTSLSLIPSFICGFILSAIGLDYLFLQSPGLLIAKYTSHAADVVSNNQGVIIFIGRIIRNIGLQSVSLLSLPCAILLVLSLGILVSKKINKTTLCILISLVPYVVLMQYWHAGLYGRLAIGIIFPVSLLFSLVVTKRKWQIIVVLCLTAQFILFLSQQWETPLIYRSFQLIQHENTIAVVTSDFNRFLYEENRISHFPIKGTTTQVEIQKFIDANLKTKKVLIDSSAIRYPYFQFDGNNYNPVSLNPKGLPLISNLLSHYRTTLYKGSQTSQIYLLQIFEEK